MKTLFKYSMVVVMLFSFVSCDTLDELTEIDFNTTLDEQLMVTVPAGNDLTLNQSMAVNIINSDTEDYLDVLQNVTITSFTYRLVNFSGDVNGTIVGNLEADGIQLVAHDMIVKNTVDAGTIFTVTNTSALNTIAAKLKNGDDVMIGLVGTSNCEEPMSFTIDMTIGLAITADVL